MKRSIIVITVALLALAGGITARNFLPRLFSSESSPLPEFSFPDLSGKERSISEWQGKVLVLNFWATWCPTCREEIPDFIALQQQYADQGLQVIGIAIEEKAPVDEYLDFVKINYPTLIAGDQGMALSRRLGNILAGVPFTLIVDRQGKIVESETGKFAKEDIVKIIMPLLN